MATEQRQPTDHEMDWLELETFERQSVTVRPRKGMRFLHRRVLDTAKFDGKTRQLYEVTRVASGWVYYAPVYDAGIVGSERLGKSDKCELDQFQDVTGGKVRL